MLRGRHKRTDMKNEKRTGNPPSVTEEIRPAEIREIPLADIVVPKRRARRLRNVTSLAESIAQIELIESIVVRRLPDGRLVLVSGAHRLEAHRQLGRETILARIIVVSDLEAELIELDANLARIELTVLERGEHLLRRKEIYEQMYPEAKHGGAPGKKGGGKKAKDATVASFAEDTSSKIGLSVRTIQDDVTIARLPADARQAIRGTPIEDQKRVLLQITRIAPDKQAAVAEAVASGRCRSVAQAAIELGFTIERPSRPRRSDITGRVREAAQPLREARKRWHRLIRGLDPAHAPEAQAIGEEIAALEKKIATLMTSIEMRTAVRIQNGMVPGTTTNASDTLNAPRPSMASELARPSHEAHDASTGREEGPRADVAAAVEAAIDLQKIIIADKALEITGLGLEELREGEALVEPLAEIAKTVARLSRPRPHRGRRRGASRRSSTVPNFVNALRPILPANSALAQRYGDVLRVLEVFDLAGKYLRKIEPALERAYIQHATMRANNPSSAAICESIDRYMPHGPAFVAGEYTFLHYLEANGVPSALFRDAAAAFVQEVTVGMRTTSTSFGAMLKRSPSPAKNAPAAIGSIQLPITAPLDEPAFKELCEIVRDCVAIMDEGCDTLAEIYRGRPVPPDVQEVWQDASARAQQCRPLLEGTFTHADHLGAWGVDPATYVAGRAAPVSNKSSAAQSAEPPLLPPGRPKAVQQRPEAPSSSEDMQAEPLKPLPAAAQKEFSLMLCRYLDHCRRERVEQEIRKADWPAHVQEAALQLFWTMACKQTPPAPPPSLAAGGPGPSPPR